MMNGQMSPEDIGQWILDAASSELRDVQRKEVLAYLQDALSSEPSAELWYLVGNAYYHLWQSPLEPDMAADAIGALNQALRIDPTYEWARLYKVYLQFECEQFISCLADARALDRSWFLDSPVEWRAISADEIEFACLVRLGIRTPRMLELYHRILDLANPDDDDLWPYRPTIFAESFQVACSAGYFADSDVSAMTLEVANLMERVGPGGH